jgi:hypothetical protein
MMKAKRIDLAALDAVIAELSRKALAVAKSDGWNSAAYFALSREIAARRAVRARVLARRGR